MTSKNKEKRSEKSEMASKFVDTRRGKIHYLHFARPGSPCALILPGFTMTSPLYAKLARRLNGYDIDVIVVDYWGRYESDIPNDGNFSLSSQISLVSSLLDGLGVSRCHVIGVSYGAAVASGLVSRMPDVVEKMVFISPLHFTNDGPSPLQKFILGAPYLGPKVLAWAAPVLVPEQVRAMFGDEKKYAEAISRAADICLKQFSDKSHAYAISKSIADFDMRDVDQVFAALSKVNKRIMVFFGSKDPVVNLLDCKSWWNRWVQNAVIVNCNDHGHLLYLEKEKYVAKKISKFFLANISKSDSHK